MTDEVSEPVRILGWLDEHKSGTRDAVTEIAKENGLDLSNAEIFRALIHVFDEAVFASTVIDPNGGPHIGRGTIRADTPAEYNKKIDLLERAHIAIDLATAALTNKGFDNQLRSEILRQRFGELQGEERIDKFMEIWADLNRLNENLVASSRALHSISSNYRKKTLRGNRKDWQKRRIANLLADFFDENKLRISSADESKFLVALGRVFTVTFGVEDARRIARDVVKSRRVREPAEQG